MYESISFSIIPFGISFAPKRAKVFTDIILKGKGYIISPDTITIDSFPLFILTSKQIISIKDIFPKLDINKNEELFKWIYSNTFNYEWITACAKEKKWVDNAPFRIHLNNTITKMKIECSTINEIPKKDVNVLKSIFSDIEYWETHCTKNKENICLSQDVYGYDPNAHIERYWNGYIDTDKDDIGNVNSQLNSEFVSNQELFDDIWNNKTKYQSEWDNGNEDFWSHISKEDEYYQLTQTTLSVNDIPVNCGGKAQSMMQPMQKKKGYYSLSQGNWAFWNSSSFKNHNNKITNELEKVLEYHTNEGNTFEALAYRKAISSIKKYPEQIMAVSQIEKLKNVGQKIGDKIREIILTGKCQKSNFVGNDEKNKSIKELCLVHGIGIKQANEFYRQGIKTVEQLRKTNLDLPVLIKKGLEYFDDLQQKIPRIEVEEIFNNIQDELFQILPKEMLYIEVCGSYRRGKSLCGDIDVIITRNDSGQIDGILTTLVEKLMQKQIVVEILTLGLKHLDSNHVFMGICVGKSGIHRRLDIKVYNQKEFPFAVLYFTGSAYFNRSLRLFARKKKMHLSDKELSNRWTGEKIKCLKEEDIFKALGIGYKTPSERDI